MGRWDTEERGHVFAPEDTLVWGEKVPQFQLPFAQGGGSGRARRSSTPGMTVAQGAAISVPGTGRVCPQGCEGKASSKRPGQGSGIHPRSAVTKCPREGKRSAPQPRALLRAQPMPSSPRLGKRARCEPELPIAPRARLTARGRAVFQPPPRQGPRGTAGLGEPRPEPGDLTLCGEGALESGRREKSYREKCGAQVYWERFAEGQLKMELIPHPSPQNSDKRWYFK